MMFPKDNKEKTGCKRITMLRRRSSHRGLGPGAASFTLTQRAPVCARQRFKAAPERISSAWTDRAVPCAYKKDSVGIKFTEWFRFMVRQKHQEAREERIMLTFLWPQTQPTLFCSYSMITQGKNAKGVTICKAALCFFA